MKNRVILTIVGHVLNDVLRTIISGKEFKIFIRIMIHRTIVILKNGRKDLQIILTSLSIFQSCNILKNEYHQQGTCYFSSDTISDFSENCIFTRPNICLHSPRRKLRKLPRHTPFNHSTYSHDKRQKDIRANVQKNYFRKL